MSRTKLASSDELDIVLTHFERATGILEVTREMYIDALKAGHLAPSLAMESITLGDDGSPAYNVVPDPEVSNRLRKSGDLWMHPYLWMSVMG